jgi:hypothetical protein
MSCATGGIAVSAVDIYIVEIPDIVQCK